MQRDRARLLGDGRAAGLGAALAAGSAASWRGARAGGGRRRGPRRRSARATTATSSCWSCRRPDRGLPGGVAAADGRRARRAPSGRRRRPSERARLARAVHDGVLQVLALVQRRGAELGGEAAELGRLAGEQEAALRALIRGQDAVAAVGVRATLDLAAELARLAAVRRVSVAGPGRAGAAAGRDRDRAGGGGRGLPATTSRRHVGRRRAGLGAARGAAGPGGGDRARRGPGDPGGPAGGGRAARAGWASAARSAAGWPTSAARRRWRPGRSAPSGS